MKRNFLLIGFMLVTLHCQLSAQCDYPFPPGTIYDDESSLPVFCDGIDGYCSTLPPQYTFMELLGCPPGEFGIHNAHLIRFIAGSPVIQLRISPAWCQGTPGGTGIQAAIYPLGHPLYDPHWPTVVECGDGFFLQDIILISGNFEVGKPYYLLIDGWAGDVCEYHITVEVGSTLPLPLDEEPTITGPSEVCDGDIVDIGASITGACVFNFSYTGGVSVGGNGYYSDQVLVTDASNFMVCAVATNYCFESEEACLTIPEGEPEVILDTMIMATICDGDSYFFMGTWLTDEGMYIDSIKEDCEVSIFNLDLEVNEVPITSEVIQECTSDCIEWNDMTLCVSGVYTAELTSYNGCDSIVELNLELLENVETSFSATVCDNETYEWNGTNYFPGTYMQTFPLPNGCDSIVTLELEQIFGSFELFEWEICSGHQTYFEGVAYNMTGWYPHIFTAANGCDSVRVLDLTVLPAPVEELNETICEGETVTVGESNYYLEGTYTVELLDDMMCDSVVILNLTVLPNYFTSIDTAISIGGTYQDIPIYQDTSWINVYTAANGCDSLVVVDISIITSVASLENELRILLYPNPAASNAHLQLNIKESLVLDIAIYNLLGQQVATVKNKQEFAPGQHHIPIELKSLPTGTYLVRIESEKGRAVRKLIKH